MLKLLLESEIKSIHPAESCRRSIFEDFAGDIHIANCMKQEAPPIHFPLRSISKSLWDIETTIHRLQWQKELFFHETIDFGQWYIYAQADIRLFHIEIRSLLDHLGLCIKHLCDGKKPKDSFSALTENYQKYFEAGIIPKEFHELLGNCSWFESFRDTRDKIVHEGAEVDVFGMKTGEPILFWVRKKDIKIIQENSFFFNSNGVLNFENYASYYMANIYSILDVFGEIAYKFSKIKRTQVGGASRSHGGLSVIRTWMQNLLEEIISEGKPNPYRSLIVKR